MLIDTHAHLNDAKYSQGKLNEIINSMQQDNLEKIITVSASLSDSQSNQIIASNNNNIYCAVGIHPENVSEITDDNMLILEKLAQNKKVIAIGEIGLDYFYTKENKKEQKEGFLKQLYLAYKLKLPIIIHLRDAYEDMLEILKTNKEFLKYGFEIHCYSGSREYAEELLKLGAYFSFTGNITFKNAKKTIEVIEYLPVDRIMVETDCPYLSPEPIRGTVNEPKNVKYVFQKISEIKNICKSDLDKIIRENVRNFYKI